MSGKHCNRCLKSKPLGDFYRNPDGSIRAGCRSCHRAYSKKTNPGWQRDNPERCNAKTKRCQRRKIERGTPPFPLQYPPNPNPKQMLTDTALDSEQNAIRTTPFVYPPDVDFDTAVDNLIEQATAALEARLHVVTAALLRPPVSPRQFQLRTDLLRQELGCGDRKRTLAQIAAAAGVTPARACQERKRLRADLTRKNNFTL